MSSESKLDVFLKHDSIVSRETLLSALPKSLQFEYLDFIRDAGTKQQTFSIPDSIHRATLYGLLYWDGCRAWSGREKRKAYYECNECFKWFDVQHDDVVSYGYDGNRMLGWMAGDVIYCCPFCGKVNHSTDDDDSMRCKFVPSGNVFVRKRNAMGPWRKGDEHWEWKKIQIRAPIAPWPPTRRPAQASSTKKSVMLAPSEKAKRMAAAKEASHAMSDLFSKVIPEHKDNWNFL